MTPLLRRFHQRASSWLIGPALLLATACGVILVANGPDRWFGIALATLFCGAVGWILLSVFLPATTARICPACARETLQRVDERSARGVVCGACGHVDPDASSFLLAEEEDPPERKRDPNEDVATPSTLMRASISRAGERARS